MKHIKTILWATLTANGNYARATAERPPRPEALADFAAQATAAGNFIAGRRTFEAFQTDTGRKVEDAERAFAGLELVVVSGQGLSIPGITCVPGPRAALEHLAARGHKVALLGGGESLLNAFLAEGLVDELVLNISPVFEDAGLKLLLPSGTGDLELLESRELGGGLVQLRYAFKA